MAPRALGAILACVAAVLFTVSLVTSSWWDGHPEVGGKTIARKDVHIGLHGAHGCNLGETEVCEPLQLGETFTNVGYGELGAGALAGVLAIVLALACWRVSEQRKGVAVAAIATSGLAAAGAIVLIVIGPHIQAEVVVHAPMGWGLFVFFGGVATTVAASVVARRVTSQPLRLRGSLQNVTPPPVDVRQILRDQHDGLRPAALGPAPVLGGPMPPSPGGNLAGPAGPLAPGGANPLFEGAPQLRPLYDFNGSGIVPAPAPVQLPARGPTPVPRSFLNDFGVPPTPPPGSRAQAPIMVPPRDSGPIDPPPPVLPAATERRGKTLPPPTLGTVQPPARAKPRTNTPPARGAQTIAHAVPPPPSADNLGAPAVLPAEHGGRAPTDADDRLDTALRDTDYHSAAAAPDTHEMRAPTESTVPVLRQAPRPATEDIETIALDRVSSPDLDAGRRDSTATLDRHRTVDGLDETIEQNPKLPKPSGPERSGAKVPISTAPSSLPPPQQTQVAAAGPSPACPQCEAPMAWVEEHLRFYCKQCRMYF